MFSRQKTIPMLPPCSPSAKEAKHPLLYGWRRAFSLLPRLCFYGKGRRWQQFETPH